MIHHPLNKEDLADGNYVYMQPGGCLEVGGIDSESGRQDLVHICGDDIEDFLEAVGSVRMEHERRKQA